jgi:hypothetical protein
MQSALSRYLDKSIRLLGDAFRRRMVWITDQRIDFLGQESSKPALVAFIGREHFSERRRIYPVQSRVELLRILRLEAATERTTLIHLGPVLPEGRMVTRYELKSGVLAIDPKALLWIPETLALSKALSPGSFVEVSRADLRYFVAADGRSQLAGGSIADGAQFVIGAGLGAGAAGSAIDAASLPSLLTQGIRQLSLADFSEFVSRDINRSVEKLVRPVSIIAASFVLAYLVVSSLYLGVYNQVRSWQLDRIAVEVAPLFESERQVDALSSRSAALAGLINSRHESWPLWEVVPLIWKNEGFLTGVFLDGDKLLLRARAPSAVAVLEAIATSPVVMEARFEAGVRQNAGQEDFAIVLRLKASQEQAR